MLGEILLEIGSLKEEELVHLLSLTLLICLKKNIKYYAVEYNLLKSSDSF